MPKEKILFISDACVNGPHNNVKDADVGEWIKTLELVKQLGAEKVCPGHDPMGGPEIIADQQAYFIALQAQVKALPDIRAALKKNTHIARYVPANLTAHVQKVYVELGGQPLPE